MRGIVLLFIILFSGIGSSLAQTRPFAQGEVDNPNPYAGEPIVYTLRIFSQDTIANSTLNEPNFVGFGRSSIVLEPVSYADTIDGISYNVIEQSYVLYPLRSGILTIEPFQIDMPETPFASANIIFVEAVTIDVQAYPGSVPENFTNAIGQFDIAVEANPIMLNSGDALTVNFSVSGTGNLEQMLAPELDLPDSWRILETENQFQQDNLRFGNKNFRWTIIVQGDGEANFPAIDFGYFNPQTGQYESRRTAPIALNIAPSTPQAEVTIERTPIATQAVIAPELLRIQSMLLPPAPPNWFWILWIFPPLFTFFVWVVGRPKQENKRRASKPRKKSGSKALKELSGNLKKAQSLDPKAAYQSIAGSIYAYLGSKTGEIVSADNISERLSIFPEKYADALLSCIEEANSGQYAPIAGEDVQRLSQRVLRVCNAIEKVKI